MPTYSNVYSLWIRCLCCKCCKFHQGLLSTTWSGMLRWLLFLLHLSSCTYLFFYQWHCLHHTGDRFSEKEMPAIERLKRWRIDHLFKQTVMKGMLLHLLWSEIQSVYWINIFNKQIVCWPVVTQIKVFKSYIQY